MIVQYGRRCKGIDTTIKHGRISNNWKRRYALNIISNITEQVCFIQRSLYICLQSNLDPEKAGQFDDIIHLGTMEIPSVVL